MRLLLITKIYLPFSHCTSAVCFKNFQGEAVMSVCKTLERNTSTCTRRVLQVSSRSSHIHFHVSVIQYFEHSSFKFFCHFQFILHNSILFKAC